MNSVAQILGSSVKRLKLIELAQAKAATNAASATASLIELLDGEGPFQASDED